MSEAVAWVACEWRVVVTSGAPCGMSPLDCIFRSTLPASHDPNIVRAHVACVHDGVRMLVCSKVCVPRRWLRVYVCTHFFR